MSILLSYSYASSDQDSERLYTEVEIATKTYMPVYYFKGNMYERYNGVYWAYMHIASAITVLLGTSIYLKT
jgi:hypothetical protein